ECPSRRVGTGFVSCVFLPLVRRVPGGLRHPSSDVQVIHRGVGLVLLHLLYDLGRDRLPQLLQGVEDLQRALLAPARPLLGRPAPVPVPPAVPGAVVAVVAVMPVRARPSHAGELLDPPPRVDTRPCLPGATLFPVDGVTSPLGPVDRVGLGAALAVLVAPMGHGAPPAAFVPAPTRRTDPDGELLEPGHPVLLRLHEPAYSPGDGCREIAPCKGLGSSEQRLVLVGDVDRLVRHRSALPPRSVYAYFYV